MSWKFPTVAKASVFHTWKRLSWTGWAHTALACAACANARVKSKAISNYGPATSELPSPQLFRATKLFVLLSLSEVCCMKPRILIVDDHEIVREGIRNLLARSGQEWEICGEASSASEAIVIVKSVPPEVIILDVTMPGISGLEAARLISKLDVPTRVLIFTMHESERMETEVRDSGAHGYVSKSQAARDLVRAIQTLLVGGTFFGAPSEP